MRRSMRLLLVVALAAGCGSSGDSSSSTPTSSPTPAPTPTAAITPEPTAAGTSREQAIAIARSAAPRYADDDVLTAEMGRFGDLVSPFVAGRYSPVPEPGGLVWRIVLGEQPSPTGGEGVEVIVDFWDGRVILTGEWVS